MRIPRAGRLAFAIPLAVALTAIGAAQAAPGPRRHRRTRRPGKGRHLGGRRQGRLRHLAEHGQQGLVHGQRRRPDRGLLPAHRHARDPRHPARGHRRRHLRRPRGRGHRAPHRAGRGPQPGLPPGQHGDLGQVPHHQDLRHRPRPLGGAGGRPVRVAHRQPVHGLRAPRRRPGPERQRRHRPHGRGRPGGRRRRARRARCWPRAASRRPRAATSTAATAGRTCARTSPWTTLRSRRRPGNVVQTGADAAHRPGRRPAPAAGARLRPHARAGPRGRARVPRPRRSRRRGPSTRRAGGPTSPGCARRRPAPPPGARPTTPR